MQKITILGSTGSIGTQTLDVVALHPDRYQIEALVAKNNVDRLYDQCLKFNPAYVVLADSISARQLSEKLRSASIRTEVLTGKEAIAQVAGDAGSDIVVSAIVGAEGLIPTLAAIRAGKRVLLANKEALIMAGHIFMKEVKSFNAQLLPVDSEHSAILQCLPANFVVGHTNKLHPGVKSIVLTASGGPFRFTPVELLKQMSPEQAIAHPNWNMGAKISIDSATMMNKGLEVIEAHWLFGLSAEQIEVVIHPQSIIHSVVRYLDGSSLAQLGIPDMRTPISVALSWPNRIHSGVSDLDLLNLSQLNFYPMDYQRYPCLKLAYEALKNGGTASVILNAANEVAVSAFLQRRILFTQIVDVIQEVLERIEIKFTDCLETVLEVDQEARQLAINNIHNIAMVL